MESLSEQTTASFWLVCPKCLPTDTRIWWMFRCQEIQSSHGKSPYGLRRWAVLLRDQHRHHRCDVLPPLRNIKEESVTARKENVNLLIMWSPAARGITVTFLCFQYFDYLLSHPLHSSKVNEAKQERSRKVSQQNAYLLTEPKECKRNAEAQEYVKYSCITDMLEQTHTNHLLQKVSLCMR